MPGGTHGETHASDASRKKREGAPSHLPTKHHAFLVQQISQPRLSWLATALIAGAGTGLAAAGLAAFERAKECHGQPGPCSAWGAAEGQRRQPQAASGTQGGTAGRSRMGSPP